MERGLAGRGRAKLHEKKKRFVRHDTVPHPGSCGGCVSRSGNSGRPEVGSVVLVSADFVDSEPLSRPGADIARRICFAIEILSIDGSCF